MKIIITGPAAAFDADERPIVDAAVLASLHGLEDADAKMADYVDDSLDDLGVAGGSLRIEYDAAAATLRVVTEYTVARALTDDELRELVDYTSGQWSDGLGEDCFSEHRERTGIAVTVSPITGGPVHAEQIDDGSPGRPVSALLNAARSGDVARIEALLESGADLEAEGRWGQTALLVAILRGHRDAALLLIARGANVRHKDSEGHHCVTLCARSGDLSVLSAALAAGGLINEPDAGGMTPLMWAANAGRLEAVRLLIDRGADVDLRGGTRNDKASSYTFDAGIVDLLRARERP